MIEENHEKTSVRLVGTGIWTRDLPNASLMHYHGATSLGKSSLCVCPSTYSLDSANSFICVSRIKCSYMEYYPLPAQSFNYNLFKKNLTHCKFVSYFRILRADIVNGINVAVKTLSLSNRISAIRLKLQLLPFMFTILLLRQNVTDCQTLLSDMEDASLQDSDKSALTW